MLQGYRFAYSAQVMIWIKVAFGFVMVYSCKLTYKLSLCLFALHTWVCAHTPPSQLYSTTEVEL